MTATSDRLSAAKPSLLDAWLQWTATSAAEVISGRPVNTAVPLLAAWLEWTAASAAEVVSARPVNAAVPLSPTQKRLWSIERFAPGTPAYAGTQDSSSAARLQQPATPAAEAIPARPAGSAVPLSPAQKRTWFRTAAYAGTQPTARMEAR